MNLKLSEILNNIQEERTFEATCSDGSFTVKINSYVPYCCMAIHDGTRLREDLRSKIALNNYERWYEEDPFTGEFINSLPITLIAHDSRFEYDLNRAEETCIYEEAWGKRVWKKPLTLKEKKLSTSKHHNFYKVVYALIKTLEKKFGGCIVYDIHSYNHKRWERSVPLFNIGTENVDQNKFKESIAHWEKELAAIKLQGIDNVTKQNDVFFGRGFCLEYITKNFDNTLVLATEVKKVYCNEQSGESFPKVVKQLQQKLKQAILNNAHFFINKNTQISSRHAANLLDKKTDDVLLETDKKLFALLDGFELLAYVNPTNTASEEKKFFRNKFTELPRFKYAPIKINPFELKQQLSSVNTKEIADISIRHMYESVIGSYFDKIDLLASLNSKKFLYNSLRYFGRPSKLDLLNAQYILHLPSIPEEPVNEPFLPIDQVMQRFKLALDSYGISCKLELSDRVISQVMVLNSRKTILFRPDAKFTDRDVNALIEHEIGVHMVTTQNSLQQELKVFNLGLPVNTLTQEGLAILSEYLSGSISLRRLKKLALRVVIADMMCNGADFIECFKFLVQHHNVEEGDAYTIVTRVFRGGGFTKDYLYLSGFIRVLKLWKKGTDLKPFLVGKTSFEFYNTISEMIEREMVSKPIFVTRSFTNPQPEDNSSIYDYILSGLK